MSAAPKLYPTAAELLHEAWVARISISLSHGKLSIRGNVQPSAAFVEALRERRGELIDILGGERCRLCGEPVDRSEPGVLAFGDRSAAHVECYDAAEDERINVAATRALMPSILTDDGETLGRPQP